MLNMTEKQILNVVPAQSPFGGVVGAKLSSIADCSNLSKSTVWRYLQKLVKEGYVTRVDLPYKNHFVSRYTRNRTRTTFDLKGL